MASSSSSIPPLSYAVSAPAPGPIRPEFHELAHTTYLVQSSDPSLTDLDMSCYGDRRHRGEILGPITQSLATNTSLTRLNLGDNGLHRMPVSDEAIRTNSTLQDLSLRMSYLRIEAGFIQALAENSVLTRLDLRGNLITPGALSQFALTLRANTILRELNLTSGSGNPAVVHNSSELQPDRDAAVIPLAEALIDNSTLTKLSLGANHIGGGGSAEALGRALRGNCCLVDLDLNLNSFSDVTAEHLVTALYVNTVLQRLDLGRNNLSATFVRNLCQALRHNTTLTDIGLNSQVRSLIGDPHVWHQREDFAWGFDDGGITDIALMLTQNSSLRTLSLEEDDIGDHGMRQLAVALSCNSTLTRLNLSRNRCRGASAEDIGRMLLANSSLIELNLAMSFQRETIRDPFPDSIMEHIATGLTGNTSLQRLVLYTKAIRENEVAHLRRALEQNSTLTSLSDPNDPYADVPEVLMVALRRNAFNAAQREVTLVGLLMHSLYKRVFESYASEEKGRVYHKIWELSGKPTDDPLFGEHNVYVVDRSIFLRAVALAGFDLDAGLDRMLSAHAPSV